MTNKPDLMAEDELRPIFHEYGAQVLAHLTKGHDGKIAKELDNAIAAINAYTTNKINEARIEAKAEELHYLTTANIYTVLMLHPDLLDKLKKREASYKEKLALNHRRGV